MSKLYTLDIGIISGLLGSLLFLRFIISRINKCDTAAKVIMSVNIFQVTRWEAQAGYGIQYYAGEM